MRPKLIEAYADDLRRAAMGEELADFHKEVGRLIKEFARKDLSRTHIKNVNFAQVFAAGIRKMALQLGVPKDQIPGREEPLIPEGRCSRKWSTCPRPTTRCFPR
jgi:hypothetical protein